MTILLLIGAPQISRFATVGAISCLLLAGCAAPREAYVPQIDALTQASDGLAKLTDAELGEFRATERGLYFRVALTNWIMENKPPSKLVTDGGAAILCESRRDYARLRGEQAYIAAVGVSLKEVSAAPSDDLNALLGALTKDYQIILTAPPDPSAISAECEVDIKDYINSVYPTLPVPRTESFVGVFAAGQELLKILKEVITPVATAALKEVDNQRRAKALETFLADPNNQANIKNSINDLAKFVSTGATEKRRHKTKKYRDALNEFSLQFLVGATSGSNPTTKLMSQEPGSCGMLKSGAVDRGAREFQACYNAIWSKWNPAVEKVLTAAADYDTEADKSLSDEAKKLNEITAKLAEIANGKIDRNVVLAFYHTAGRLLALANTVKSTASDDNKKKVQDALKKLNDAL